MIVYLDTSALVKLYVQEVGSTEVKRAVARADLVATSLIAYVEVRSAFARRHRLADIDDAALKRHEHEFEQGWNRLDRLPVDATTIHRAGELAEQYRLKAYDALHLATVDLMEVNSCRRIRACRTIRSGSPLPAIAGRSWSPTGCSPGNG